MKNPEMQNAWPLGKPWSFAQQRNWPLLGTTAKPVALLGHCLVLGAGCSRQR